MTDSREEARRHERRGIFTVARVWLIGGGLIAGLAPAPPSVAAAQEPVLRELSVAVATVMNGLFEDAKFELEPTESGFGLRYRPGEGAVASWSLDFSTVNEIMDKVARGESVLASVKRLDGNDPIPDWVPVYPGAHRYYSFLVSRADFTFGVAGYVVEGGGHRMLDWYDRTTKRMARIGTTLKHRVILDERVRGLDLRRDLGRYSVGWDDRLVTVFVLEDDHGDSVLVVLYKRDPEGTG
ncbi:MAG: hypothetical protein F4087_06135 [Gemmatimonadetes bacterium]|nr:hypothetical protein [Gemmatimonadota bacterium]MDE2677937.1 hypothetical protein [Gemmatimonadota bacterium]MXX36272.1 hypothetical protein [Gemmatimonadota bacterium]MYA10161.1 hypothetical protein [Gemmatimonadota bacterium]MYD14240.1 hypothetical protein [Gemmatimonadota bacterium]